MAQSDVGVFEAKVLPYLDDAYSLARYLLRDEHDAQDVVQDATLRAFQHVTSHHGDDARAWLLAIVRNCCYTWLNARQTDRARRAEPGAELDIADPRGADELAIRTSEQARVESALARLPFELREVVVLRELEELSYREISDIVGVPMGTVMSRLSRARARLAALLNASAEEAS